MRKETALLVVDVQQGVVEWDDPECRGDEVLANINLLLERARESQTPIIYVQHDGGEGERLALESAGWPIHPAIAPQDGETVVHKTACDSFYETSLKDELESRGIKHLVITGCRTQYCVDTTCRSAVAHGYNVTLAKDAHTTMSTETLTASQIIAHHNETLDEMGTEQYMIVVRESKEIEF